MQSFYYLPTSLINFNGTNIKQKDCYGLIIDNNTKVNLSYPTEEKQNVVVLFSNRKKYQLRQLTVTENNLIFNTFDKNGKSCRLKEKDILEIAPYIATIGKTKTCLLTKNEKKEISSQIREKFNDKISF